MTPSRPQLETAGDSPELETLIRARYPILYIASWEEERVERALQEIAQRRGKRLVAVHTIEKDWTQTGNRIRP